MLDLLSGYSDVDGVIDTHQALGMKTPAEAFTLALQPRRVSGYRWFIHQVRPACTVRLSGRPRRDWLTFYTSGASRFGNADNLIVSI